VIEAARRDADVKTEKAVASLASDSSSRASADFIMVNKDFVCCVLERSRWMT